MYKGIEISASLMCIDWLNAGKQLSQLEDNKLDYLHLDIIDGRFASDFTMGSSIIDHFRENTNLPSDYHLMVEEPSRLMESFQVSPRDIFTIHQECSRNLHSDLVSIRRKGARVGIALSPGTPITALDYVIEDADIILVMTVNPGYKGQPLVQQAIRKIKDLKELITRMGIETKISVDGNVNMNTVPDMVASGAEILVLGSSGLFRKDMSIDLAIGKIHRAIDLGLKRRGEA